MRLRVGFIAGFALGYYLGAMAGRERYEQINRLLRQAQDSGAFEGAAGDTLLYGVQLVPGFDLIRRQE